MHNIISKYKGLAIVLVNGAVIMCLELTGSRILAPYFGSSLYIWTGIIGIILAFLSLGYWYGGKIADVNPSYTVLSKILFMSGCVVLITKLLQAPILSFTASNTSYLLVGSFFASVFLFGPFSILLGMVSPFVAKLELHGSKHSGEQIGRVFAFGTIGSILGTFLTGYILFTFVGSSNIVILCAMVLLLLSILSSKSSWGVLKIVVLAVSVAMLLWYRPGGIEGRKLLYNGDTQYSHVTIYDTKLNGRAVRLLTTDGIAAQSGIDLIDERTPFNYMQAFEQIAQQRPTNSALLIGGGSFSFADIFTRAQPSSQLDIVEIDPALQDLAKKYFKFKPTENVRITHADARAYLNTSTKKYDIIYGDAYSSLTPPFQLSSVEAIAKMKSSLNSDGRVVVNIISRASAGHNFLQTQLASYQRVFKNVEAYQLKELPGEQLQNSILLASDAPIVVPRTQQFSRKVLQNSVVNPLTDDFAPVEMLTFYSN